MIVGTVNSSHEPVIHLTLLNAQGQSLVVTALLDTGFSGSLTLPPDTIAALGLPFRSRGSATLADGSTIHFDIYAALLDWDGSPRPILVEAADTESLLGMALLSGHDIHIEAVDGGSVTLQKRLP